MQKSRASQPSLKSTRCQASAYVRVGIDDSKSLLQTLTKAEGGEGGASMRWQALKKNSSASAALEEKFFSFCSSRRFFFQLLQLSPAHHIKTSSHGVMSACQKGVSQSSTETRIRHPASHDRLRPCQQAEIGLVDWLTRC